MMAQPQQRPDTGDYPFVWRAKSRPERVGARCRIQHESFRSNGFLRMIEFEDGEVIEAGRGAVCRKGVQAS